MTMPAPAKCARKGCRTVVRQLDEGRPRLTCCDACRSALYRQRVKVARRTSVEWYTPADVLDWFWARWGPFDADPCSSPTSLAWARVEHRLTVADDGLVTRWPGTRAFVNPPYGRGHLDRWADRGWRAVAGLEVERAALLVPLRPSSAWCRLALDRGAILDPVPWRIRFLEPQPDGTLLRTSGALFECTALVFRDAESVTKLVPS